MAIIIVTCLPGGPAHAQSGTDVSPAVPVHPDVPTTLRLPDAIERAWIHYGDDFRVKGVGSEVYVRPRRGTPAGAEALLEVKTATMHRIFLLRVVARPEDAKRELTVPTAAATHVEEADRDAAPDALTPAEPAENAPSPAPAPAATEPAALEPPTPEPASAVDAERAPATALSPRFALSLHAFAGVGFAGLEFAGYESEAGFQPLHTIGLRLAGARSGARWALEASVSGERLTGALTFRDSNDSEIEVSGPLLRAEVGTRARLVRASWMASGYFGIGAQTHLRRTERRSLTGERESLVSAMQHGAVATLGMGLQYRVRKVLLGLDFQTRHGGPDGYHAVVVLWTVAHVLDKENEP